jgi:hypothetical protein
MDKELLFKLAQNWVIYQVQNERKGGWGFGQAEKAKQAFRDELFKDGN